MKIPDDKPNQADGAAPDKAQALRNRAEETLRAREDLQPEALGTEETRRLLHELRVHQIELEMQNEELRRAQEEREASRAPPVDLYDFAPAGYVTVSEAGLLLEANLTAAALLGVARIALVRQPLSRFILPEDQDSYYRHRKQLFATGAPQVSDAAAPVTKAELTKLLGELKVLTVQVETRLQALPSDEIPASGI